MKLVQQDSSFQLDKYFRPLNSPITNNKGRMTGIEFDRTFEVQATRIKASQSATRNLVQISELGEATGSFDTGQAVELATTLAPANTFSQSRMLATPYVDVYEGTAAVGSMQIYPSMGAGIANGDYEVMSGYDLADFDEYIENFKITVENVAAGAVSIYFRTRWRYVSERSGSATL